MTFNTNFWGVLGILIDITLSATAGWLGYEKFHNKYANRCICNFACYCGCQAANHPCECFPKPVQEVPKI